MLKPTSPACADTFEALLPETRRALLHRIAVGQAEGRTPSLVGAVVRDGHPVWTGSRSCVAGHAPDADTQYRIGSITKTFAAVLVMRLRDAGRLDLDDPVDKHLGSVTAAADGLTIRQLLAHTSGLAAETPGPWWERTPGTLRPGTADLVGERLHPAGQRHHYSNPGYALLGAVAERLYGVPWGEALRREILEPLGMSRTTPLPGSPHAGGFAVHPYADVMQPEVVADTGLMAPAGQLWSTAADLCRWAAFLGGAAVPGDGAPLSPDTLAEMRVPAAPDGSYGLGLQLLTSGGRSLAGHTGSMPGFVAGLWTSPEDGLAAIALANATSGTPAGTIAADLLGIVADREPAFPLPWRPASDPDPGLLALTGAWFWGPAPFTLHLRTGRDLELRPAGRAGRGTRLRAEPDGTWTALDDYYAGETLRVVPGPGPGSGPHLDLGTFVFTRSPYDATAPVPGGTHPDGWSVTT
jgi:D-alanyl-D-alanine carboxypeptidase